MQRTDMTYNTSRHTDPVLSALYVRLYGALRAMCPRTARARIRDISARRAELYGEDPKAAACAIMEEIGRNTRLRSVLERTQ